MATADYLVEDGTGAYGYAHVPDLLPKHAASSRVDVLFVLESPHSEELLHGIPVRGATGVAALSYLLGPQAKGESLGAWVQQRQRAGDFSVGIMNVCTVPLQEQAFSSTRRPSLLAADWRVIRTVRTSTSASVASMRTAPAREATNSVVEALGGRLDQAALSAGCEIVVAGRFAQRIVRFASPSLGALVVPVPHPSHDRWSWPRNASHPELTRVRKRFRSLAE